jgi:CubicO group peptidase (beta-lactamase class C family)
MRKSRNALTRRSALAKLAGIGGLAAAHVGALPGVEITGTAVAQTRAHPPDERLPITGKAGPALDHLDKAVLAMMDRHGIPGAALAVARKGKLVYAKGFGWTNSASGDAVTPESLFGLASISKPFTAVATLLLVEQGKFGLDDPVFDLIKHVKPPPGAKVDPRFAEITVRQCLNHSGGWDRLVTGDPINWQPQICRAFQIRPPVSQQQFLSFVMGTPLQFNPGAKDEYSNVGFIVLGEVIATLSGQPYGQFITEKVLKPMDITRAALHPVEGKYLDSEAHRHLAGSMVPLPPMQLPMIDAAGGWSASVVDLVRFLTNLDGNRGKPVLTAKSVKTMLEPPLPPLKPRDDGTYFGLGWDIVGVKEKAVGCSKEGSLAGMRTVMRRMLSGLSWALLYNASMEFDHVDTRILASTVQEVRELVEKIENYPDIDLFSIYK